MEKEPTGIETLSVRDLLERIWSNQIVMYRKLDRIESYIRTKTDAKGGDYSQENPAYIDNIVELAHKFQSVKAQIRQDEEQFF
jgi:hypothetical protein